MSSSEQNRRLVDGVKTAFKKGASDARKAASQTVPKVKSLFAQTAYGIAYTISYGAIFSVSLAKERTPDPVKSGWKDGAKEGHESACETADNLKKEPEATVPPIVEPGTAS